MEELNWTARQSFNVMGKYVDDDLHKFPIILRKDRIGIHSDNGYRIMRGDVECEIFHEDEERIEFYADLPKGVDTQFCLYAL